MSIYSKGLGPVGKAALLAGLTRRRSREGHLPVIAQVAEMLWLKLRLGIGPGYYHVAGFWRRQMSWREKCAHLGGREYVRRLAELNPAAYRKLSQNKIAEKAILQLFGVPTPRFVGFLHPVVGRSASGGPLRTADELGGLLASEGVPRICFKPLEGWGGIGFRAAEVTTGPAGMRLASLPGGQARPLEDYAREILLEPGDGWVLEEYLEQHPEMRRFNPDSVNTMRLWVTYPAAGAPTMLGGYLRIGRAGSPVDNQTSGGIIARIDPATGALAAATSGHVDRPAYPVHPDHGARIEGATVPCWREASALAASTLGLFPNIRFAGFDIAVGAKGPVVIELNPSPDLQGAAEMGLALRPLLKP